MTGDGALDQVRKLADAVLYEGYLLYPYRGSAQKNRTRFQFGVLMPPAYAAVDPSEPHASQTECLLRCAGDTEIEVTVRFLHLLRRESADPGDMPWDEAAEREFTLRASADELLAGERALAVHVDGGESADGGARLHWTALDGLVTLRAERVPGPHGTLRLRLRTENHSEPAPVPRTRDDGLATAFVSAHALIAAPGASFLSMTDPPQWAAAAVAACENTGTWPVLAGPPGRSDLMLCSPVILYDHAEVAPESPGDMFDATEIDEILTLRTLTLTDEEKAAARATDPRAAALVDRTDAMPPELLGRLHGAIRYLRPVRDPAGRTPEPAVPWWDPGADASVSPETDAVVVAGVPVARGSVVRMRPGARRADAQDMFLAGRVATVEAVLHDVDGNVHLALTPADDPDADLRRGHGRFLYFGTDEIEPLSASRPAAPAAPDAPDRRDPAS